MESDLGEAVVPREIPLDGYGPDDIMVFHWSPSDRHQAISREGIKPRQKSVDGLWVPPFTCWGGSPPLAWSMSGAIHNEIASWDLWMTWASRVRRWEMIPFDDGQPREYRVYHKLAPSKIWYVGTREL